MCHLYLYVEGQTEQTFAEAVLTPHLAQHGVYLMGAVLAEFARSGGKLHRGGVRTYGPFRRGLENLFKQHDRSGIWFSSMVDLYALPKGFPGWGEAKKLRSQPQSRVAKLEQSLATDLAERRFIPYIQLHEFEALLFANPKSLDLYYPDKVDALVALQAITDAYASPELINDGKATAPSKRIIAEIPKYKGMKRAVGPDVAELIGLPVLRAKCPHFSQWVEKLEQLGAGPQP